MPEATVDSLLRSIERADQEILAAIQYGRTATTEMERKCSCVWEMDWCVTRQDLVQQLDELLIKAAA